MMHYYYGNWLGWGGEIMMVIFWIFIILIIIWAITGMGYRGHSWHNRNMDQEHKKSGLDILNQRYAKGEITKEEYEQKKKDILA